MPVSYKNPGRIEFDGEIRREGSGAFICFPHDVEKLYGVKGRVPVKVQYDGVPYRGSMVKMGAPCHLLLITKEIRERLGKDGGDRVHVIVDLDDALRIVDLAADVEAACKKAGVLEKLRAMSFTRQREFSLWIEGARQVETRRRRIEKAIEQIRAGR